MKKKKTLTNLRKMRMSRFLTQTELANLLGIKPSNVSILEIKGIRQVSTAERYAAALGCSPADLLDFKKTPSRTCACEQ